MTSLRFEFVKFVDNCTNVISRCVSHIKGRENRSRAFACFNFVICTLSVFIFFHGTLGVCIKGSRLVARGLFLSAISSWIMAVCLCLVYNVYKRKYNFFLVWFVHECINIIIYFVLVASDLVYIREWPGRALIVIGGVVKFSGLWVVLWSYLVAKDDDPEIVHRQRRFPANGKPEEDVVMNVKYFAGLVDRPWLGRRGTDQTDLESGENDSVIDPNSPSAVSLAFFSRDSDVQFYTDIVGPLSSTTDHSVLNPDLMCGGSSLVTEPRSPS